MLAEAGTAVVVQPAADDEPIGVRATGQERRRAVEDVTAVDTPRVDVQEVDRARDDGGLVVEHYVACGVVGEVIGEHGSRRADLQVPAGRAVDA